MESANTIEKWENVNMKMGDKDYLKYLVEYINKLRILYDVKISNVLDELKKTHIKATMSSATIDGIMNYLKLNPKSLQNYIDSEHYDDIDEKKIDRKFEDEIIHFNTMLRTRALYEELNKIKLDDHDSYYEMAKAMQIEENTKYKKKRQDIDAKKAEEQRIAEKKATREASWVAQAEAREKEAKAAWEAEAAARDEKAAADPVQKRSLFSFRNPIKFGGTKRKTTTKRTSKKRRSKR
jgi:hypothetical protein